LPDNAKINIKKDDLLISKVRPNRGAVSIIDFETNDLVASGAFTILRQNNNKLTSETLQVLLRTKYYRDWLLKYNVGASYPVIIDSDILNLYIPIIDISIQQTISTFIQ
jgi:type I restriction enzyme, S subunit